MAITDLFIRRPITTTLLMAGIFGFGLLSYFALPVSDLPPVEYPTIQVMANLPGANPDIMASSVATPLEKAFSNIAGVESMSSTNTNVTTSITLQFDFSRTIDSAALDVQSAISRASGELPRNMLAPPMMAFFLTMPISKMMPTMVDFAITARREGMLAEEAIFEGCLQRFRPIMMTTMCALHGTLPIAFGYGAGGEARRPLGLAVVGGLVVSQLLTLYITPVIYIYLEKLHSGASGKPQPREAERELARIS